MIKQSGILERETKKAHLGRQIYELLFAAKNFISIALIRKSSVFLLRWSAGVLRAPSVPALSLQQLTDLHSLNQIAKKQNKQKKTPKPYLPT